MKILRQMTLCLTGALLSAGLLLPMTAWAQDATQADETMSEREAAREALKEKRDAKREALKDKRDDKRDSIKERKEDRKEGFKEREVANEERFEAHLATKTTRQQDIFAENQFHSTRMTRIDKMQSDASTAKDNAMVLKAKQMRQDELTRHQTKLREINTKYAN